MTVPPPASTVSAILPVLKAIVAALLSGTEHARWYADIMDERPDSALSPALVRKGARRALVARGQDVHDESEDVADEFETELLPNLGLALHANGYAIRVLRTSNGQMPVPGPSRRRQNFYAQQGEFDFGAAGDGQVPPDAVRLNLVVHWSTDDEYNLDRVYLGCPKAGGVTRASVEAYWDELIWQRHQGAALGGPQVEAEVRDVDIHIASKVTGTDR